MEQENYFEIAAFLSFQCGNSRARNSNENKHISVAVKCNITLNSFLIQLAERREFQNNFSCSVPYHI